MGPQELGRTFRYMIEDQVPGGASCSKAPPRRLLVPEAKTVARGRGSASEAINSLPLARSTGQSAHQLLLDNEALNLTARSARRRLAPVRYSYGWRGGCFVSRPLESPAGSDGA